LVVGNEWRLVPQLRDAAATQNATTILTQAVVAQCLHHLFPRSRNLGMVLADLAVTGRGAFADFVAHPPRDGGPLLAAALTQLHNLGTPGVTPRLVQMAESEVLDRAYQVASFLRGQTSRGTLGWIAVSGEDDLPHRPVNVPRTPFPQHDLKVTTEGNLGPVSVQTRYAIATATDPDPLPAPRPTRERPSIAPPDLPETDRIILFLHGSDSRLEEANDLIPKLVRLPDGRPSGFTVIAMDMPGSGYCSPVDHIQVGHWNLPRWDDPEPSERLALLPFMEQFVVDFVARLSAQLGRDGLVESRVAAVMGGSLGGNLALRLARRSEGWIRNAIAWSPGSVWKMNADDVGDYAAAIALHVGVRPLIENASQLEDPQTRDVFFASAFDEKIPVKTQPDQWYRDDFPSKLQDVTNARLDRRETYTHQYRRWHWRISLEELVWTWRDPSVQNFRSRLLLGAGAADEIWPAQIFTNTRKLAGELADKAGDSFFFEHTGHSIHAERPDALARRIISFLTEEPAWTPAGRPEGVVIEKAMGVVTVMDAPTAPQRVHVFVAGNDGGLHCFYAEGGPHDPWQWVPMGKPAPSAYLDGAMGAVTVMDEPGTRQRTHVFVRSVGNLYCRCVEDSTWQWKSMGTPSPNVYVDEAMGAVTVMDGPNEPQRPHVFVSGAGDLYCRFAKGGPHDPWTWEPRGVPLPGIKIGKAMGAVTLRDKPTAAQRAHVFVTGTDGVLYCHYATGAPPAPWKWVPLGKPASGVNIDKAMGAVTVIDEATSTERARVFVTGTDGNLHCLTGEGGAWHWLHLGRPVGVSIVESMGAVTVVDNSQSPQLPHVFVRGSDLKLWCRWFDGLAWHWTPMDEPRPDVAIGPPMGAVTVMDAPDSPQRAHVFMKGSDGNLWGELWQGSNDVA
jgi:pimeloyl-ACP methyl ester carboxylesterase